MNNELRKKIKSQKNAGLALIFVPMVILISYVGKSNFNEYGINNYLISGALFFLMICGGIGLRNSLRKEKELNNS